MAKLQKFYQIMDEQEKKVIRWALKKGGNITEAGKILGLNRPTLSMKMKRLNLSQEYHHILQAEKAAKDAGLKKNKVRLHERFRQAFKNVR